MERSQGTNPEAAPDRRTTGLGRLRPLSFAQERLWWFGQVVAGSSNVVIGMQFDGLLAFHALEQALRVTVARHVLLRTRFRLVHGAPVQEALATAHVAIAVVDLRGLPTGQRQASARQALADEWRKPFDLTRPPLMRATLYKLDAQQHLFSVTLDHLLIDDSSRHMLTGEIAALYARLASGRPAELALPTTDYGDFALWERERFSGGEGEEQLRFWRDYLADLPALLELPKDYPRPARRSYAAAWRTRCWPSPTGEQVKALARAEGVTPFHVLLGVLGMLLARQSGSNDIAVGTPFSRRPHARYERVIGPFLNSVVVRMGYTGQASFRAFARHVRARTVAALAHGLVPFEAVVDLLRPDRDPSYNPLVQLWFVYRPEVTSSAAWQGPRVAPVDLEASVSPFDLTFSVTAFDGGLTCGVQYSTALFAADTIDRLLDQWGHLLTGVLRDPDARIDSYELLSPEARRRQLVLWNDTATTWSAPECVPEAIEAVAARQPDDIAVTMGSRALTYSALSTAAQRLAEQLGALGAGCETRVGIFVERSPELVVALLGTLRAGAAYVPLDPSASPVRVAALLRDAGARCVVSGEALRSRLPELGLPVVSVERVAELGPTLPMRHDQARPELHDNGLCYVIYTSGTTGEPKGVAVTHGAVMNLLRSQARAIGVTPDSRLLAVTPLTFDIAALEMFMPLVAGARLVIAPSHSVADGSDLRARLEREAISILQATPATWRLLLDSGWKAPVGFHALCGGEALPGDLARRLIATVGHVWNCYGPTETTIWSTLAHLAAPDEGVTIGRPIANTTVYVLDDQLQPVPVGVPGHLYIGGAGLARGYLGRTAQTAAAYLPDPFSVVPGTRMYATGDVASYRPDGSLECHGRRDQQVKLRGRRIELEAIAHVLGAHPSVRECVAVIREAVGHEEFLATYVVLTSAGQGGGTPAGARGVASTRDQEPSQPRLAAGSSEPFREADLSGAHQGVRAELRQHLAQQLPPYMVPSAIVLLDALPRTRHGKIDRKALPAPTEADYRAATAFVAPRTLAEQRVAAVWCDVLGLSAVGVEDDFFALGGTSLHATRALLLLRESLGASVSMQAFFDAPTVEALAKHVGLTSARSGTATVEVARVPRDGPLHLAPQQENWWRNEHQTGHVNPHNVHFGVRIEGALQVPAAEQALAALQRRHESLRTAFVIRADGMGAPVITPAEACNLRLAIVDLAHLPEPVQESLLRQLSAAQQGRSFDLAQGNLCRATLVRLTVHRHVMMFTTHHLICDGWSIDILMTEFSELYAQAFRGLPARLAPLRFQYVDFAAWQRAWLAGSGALSEVDYWRRQLAAPLPPLLPPGARTADFDTPYFSLRGRAPLVVPAEATAAARALARDARCTLFSTLLAGLKVVLYAVTQQPDVRVATLTANRSLPGAEQVVGLFTDAVCLRTRVEPAMRFGDLMRAVHATIGAASAHQGMPFEVLAALLEREHGIARADLFQTLVLWRALPGGSLAMPGVGTGLYRPPDENDGVVMLRSALDLVFDLSEMPETVQLTVTYQMALFTAAQIRQLVESLGRCLILARSDPAATVAALIASLDPPSLVPSLGGDQVREPASA